MNILKSKTKLNMTKKQAWIAINPINYFNNNQPPDEISSLGIIRGPVNHYFTGPDHTERLIPSFSEDKLEFDVVEGLNGPMKYSKGHILLDEMPDGNVELTVDLTYDDFFGPYGEIMSKIMADPSLSKVNLDIENHIKNFNNQLNSKIELSMNYHEFGFQSSISTSD